VEVTSLAFAQVLRTFILCWEIGYRLLCRPALLRVWHDFVAWNAVYSALYVTSHVQQISWYPNRRHHLGAFRLIFYSFNPVTVHRGVRGAKAPGRRPQNFNHPTSVPLTLFANSSSCATLGFLNEIAMVLDHGLEFLNKETNPSLWRIWQPAPFQIHTATVRIQFW